LLSLAQAVLKVASPGVTDVYQGNELWDLTLVDPDNRRSVDFARRRAMLDALRPLIEDGAAHDPARAAAIPGLISGWRDGHVKAYILGRGLHVRRASPTLFLDGDHVPLEVSGERAEHVIAFARV